LAGSVDTPVRGTNSVSGGIATWNARFYKFVFKVKCDKTKYN